MPQAPGRALVLALLIAVAGIAAGGFVAPEDSEGFLPFAAPPGDAATTAAASAASTPAGASAKADAAATYIVIYKEAAVSAAAAAQIAAAASGTVGVLSADAREAARLQGLNALKSRVLGPAATTPGTNAAAAASDVSVSHHTPDHTGGGSGGSSAGSAGRSRGSAGRQSGIPGVLVGDDPLSHLPLSVVKVSNQRALRRLRTHSSVAAVVPNEVVQPLMAQSLPIIDQPAAEAAGYTGAGCAVAILDTGANYKSKDLGSCTGVGQPATCKVKFMRDFTTVLWGMPYDDRQLDDQGHGTNVASIASRVAPGADILVLDVFFPDGAKNSDILSAINWVTANAKSRKICSMNLSLGGSYNYASPCATDPYAPAIKAARDQGVLSAIAAGNSGKVGGISSPACVPGAVSVGATLDANGGRGVADAVAGFSNTASWMSLLAPGCSITAGEDPRFTNGTTLTMCGTSMAAPHVAGAIAVLKGAVPSATPEQVIQALQDTGKPISDSRDASIVRPRISIKAAVERLKALAGGGGGSSPPDTTAPSGNFTINAGAASTNNVRVQLAISADDNSGPAAVTSMCIKNDAAVCSSSAFVPFAASRPWTLAAGASGPRTVSIWLRDALGNTMSAPLTATIQYDAPVDTTPPVGSVIINTRAQVTSARTITLSLTGADPGSGVAAWCLGNSPADCTDPASFQAVTPPAPTLIANRTWELASGADGNRTVYLWLRDGANNTMAAPASASIILDTTPPTNTSVTPDTNATFVRGPLRVNLTASGAVRVCVDAVDPSTTGNCRSIWVPFNPRSPSAMVPIFGASGPKVVRAWFADAAGLRTPQPATANITLDFAAPSMAGMVLNATGLPGGVVSVSWNGSATDTASGVGGYFLSYRTAGMFGPVPPPPMCFADGAVTKRISLPATATSASVTGFAQGTVVRLRLCAFDLVGNVAPGQMGVAKTP